MSQIVWISAAASVGVAAWTSASTCRRHDAVLRRPKLTLIGVALAAAVLMAGLAGSAAADTPVFSGGSFAIQIHPLDGVCSFELMSSATVSYTEHDYFDSNGLLTRSSYFLREQDTFIGPNGATLVGDSMRFNFEFWFDAGGNPTAVYINGIVERVHLPDGSLFISAGRIDYSADGFPDFVIAPDHGGIHNLDGLCAALAA